MTIGPIQNETLPPVRVLTRNQQVLANRLPTTIDAVVTALESEAQASGLTVSGEPFVRYLGPVTETQDGPIQVCLPVEGAGGLVMPEIPAVAVEADGEDATFPGAMGVYAALERHMAEHGLTADAPPRETLTAGRLRVEWPVRPA